MMKNTVPCIAGLILALACFSASGATEENIHKQFPAKAGGTLVVEVDFGAIELKTNSGEEVVVDVWRKVTRRKKVDEEAFLKERPVEISSSGGKISILEQGKSGSRSSGWKNRNEGKYTISVPARFDVNLRTGGGAMSVRGLAGDVKAKTSGGGLSFEGIEGPIDGKTSGGGIEVKNCNGPIVIKTSGGHIEVTGGSGTLDGKTSGGGIALSDFNGPADVSTSGGHIRINDAAGALEASTSGGSIEASLKTLAGPVNLASSGGHIAVAVPGDAAFDLDARTSGGHVSCSLPITIVGKVERESLSGKVNGGGKQVHLRTSGGSIEVKKH